LFIFYLCYIFLYDYLNMKNNFNDKLLKYEKLLKKLKLLKSIQNNDFKYKVLKEKIDEFETINLFLYLDFDKIKKLLLN
jgi:hypothetical protein